MMSAQCLNNMPDLSVQYPGHAQSLLCEEDELVLDYDSDILKDFNLFSSTFSLEDLMNEIPVEMPPTSRSGVREDCMWAERRLEEKLDIDVINSNMRCAQLQLVSPNSIISIQKDYFMRHLIASPEDFDVNNTDDGCHDCNNNLESPTSSTFDSSDDGCSQVFYRRLNEQCIVDNDTDEEIDVVGDEQDTATTTLTTEYLRSATPETPTFEGTFNLTERSNIQCVLDTRIGHHGNDVSAAETIVNEKPERKKRSRKGASKYAVKQEKPEQPGCSSSEETASVNEKLLNRSESHNHLEKKRRVNLKRKFEVLRQVLPSLQQSDKAAKVVILKEAIRECRHLKINERDLILEKRAAFITQETLQNRLAELTYNRFSEEL